MIGFKQKKKLEQEQKTQQATASVTGIVSGGEVRKKGYEIRVQKDLDELEPKWSDNLKTENVDLLNHFTLTLSPDEGIWKNHAHVFDISVPDEYPIKPPKVLCKTKVYHPNIDQEGHICLNILREDWKPVLNLNAIFTGLHFLFLEPNPSDPLDTEAANVYEKDYDKFKRIANNYMRGNYSKY
ncbi:NEDD8-conjugating enzyme [Acrasis kona]|uniref:NEDD8 carrier protein n=1 Tax=Acrasis kona TaxID=1008807 RepID=A0AAW2YRB5_9EUKA